MSMFNHPKKQEGSCSMKRIGVLSDTHLRYGSEEAAWLEMLCSEYFSDVDMVIHAGDMVDPDVLLAFDCPVHAVKGNMDDSDGGFAIKRVLKVEEVSIGLMHGWGHTVGLESRLKHEFLYDDVDCIVYGHSHYPANHIVDGILMFNPGSPVDRRQAPYHSVGILEVDVSSIKGTIINLDN